MKLYLKVIKPLFDRLAALLFLAVSLPASLPIGVLLAFDLKGSPFFTQLRNGTNGIEFKVIKFRTMTNERNDDGELLPNKDRLTKVGGLVRRTSMDEIPQMLNVLIGQMSLIGPRPLPVHYYPYFSDDEKRRFKVKPGITGLAQISGRNHLMWDKRLAKDIEYVNSISLLTDLKIIALTLKKVFMSDDIVVDPTAVMIDFDEFKKQKWQRDGRY